MKQGIDEKQLKALYTNGIIMANGHSPKNIGELSEWISNNSEYQLNICDLGDDNTGSLWSVSVMNHIIQEPVHVCESNELIDALVALALKTQESK